jgi:hypothetical protein
VWHRVAPRTLVLPIATHAARMNLQDREFPGPLHSSSIGKCMSLWKFHKIWKFHGIWKKDYKITNRATKLIDYHVY